MTVTARVLALPDSNGIKEIRNSLDQNPNEIVYVDFEEYVPQMGGPDDAVLAPIRAYLGDMVFTPPPDVPPASVTGSITDNVLTVTALGSGALGRGGLTVDDQITGTGIPPGTVIQSFGTGTGTYNLYKTSVTGSITNGVLTVTALGSSAPGGRLRCTSTNRSPARASPPARSSNRSAQSPAAPARPTTVAARAPSVRDATSSPSRR